MQRGRDDAALRAAPAAAAGVSTTSGSAHPSSKLEQPELSSRGAACCANGGVAGRCAGSKGRDGTFGDSRDGTIDNDRTEDS